MVGVLTADRILEPKLSKPTFWPRNPLGTLKGEDQRKPGEARTDSGPLIKTEGRETRRAMRWNFNTLDFFISCGTGFNASIGYEFLELVQRSSTPEGDHFLDSR